MRLSKSWTPVALPTVEMVVMMGSWSAVWSAGIVHHDVRPGR
jgi:hypothetical protein